jgi:hypothetical protein
MPFGKHRGWLLSDIPLDYLRWAWHTSNLDPWLKDAVEDELRRHCGGRAEPTSSAPQARVGVPVGQVRGAVPAWFREMALRYHPDRTLDDSAAMKVINHAHERLRELFGVE